MASPSAKARNWTPEQGTLRRVVLFGWRVHLLLCPFSTRSKIWPVRTWASVSCYLSASSYFHLLGILDLWLKWSVSLFSNSPQNSLSNISLHPQWLLERPHPYLSLKVIKPHEEPNAFFALTLVLSNFLWLPLAQYTKRQRTVSLWPGFPAYSDIYRSLYSSVSLPGWKVLSQLSMFCKSIHESTENFIGVSLCRRSTQTSELDPATLMYEIWKQNQWNCL